MLASTPALEARATRGRTRLMTGCAIGVALVAIAQAPRAHAQRLDPGKSFQGTASSALGNVSVVQTGTQDTITVNTSQAVIDWQVNDTASGGDPVNFLPEGRTGLFTNGANVSNYVVLNRIVPTDQTRGIRLDGTVRSQIQSANSTSTGGSVWFYSPGGIIAGSNALFDVGSLVLTTNAIDTEGGLFGPNGQIRFRGTEGSQSAIQIDNGARINALGANSYVAMVAPRIVQNGNVQVNGSVGYVAAEAADVTINNGLFDISFITGTEAETGISHAGTTSGPASTGSGDNHGIYFATMAKNDAVSMLLTGSIGYQAAASATVANGIIVLAAGYDVAGGAAVESGYGAGSIAIGNSNFSSDIVARATDLITVSPTGSFGNVSMNNASFTAVNGVDVGAAGTGRIRVNGDLLLRATGTGDGRQSASLHADANEFGYGGGISVLGNLTVDASHFGSGGTNGSDGVGGLASILVDDNSLLVNGDVLISAQGIGGFGEVHGGSGTGGTASFGTSAGSTVQLSGLTIDAAGIGGFGSGGDGGRGTGGSALGAFDGGSTSGRSLTVRSDGLGGGSANGYTGGRGTGGTSSVIVTDGTIDIVTTRIAADGTGGAGSSFGNLAGNGGNGLGGVVGLSLLGGSLTGEDVEVGAYGFGGNGGDTFQADSGNGGDGIGGESRITVADTASVSLISLAAGANASGGRGGSIGYEFGYGGYDFSDTPGAGGSGAGGLARIDLAGNTSLGRISVSAIRAETSSLGGSGGGFGFSGDRAAQPGFARAVPGFGGDATGGTSQIFIRGSAENFGNAVVLADAEAGDGPAKTLGGTGGTGTGGTARLNIEDGIYRAEEARLSASGTGGDGGFGPAGQYGAGGAGQGGLAALTLTGSATTSADIGNTAIRADGFGGSGGTGGSALGGSASLDISHGDLPAASSTFTGSAVDVSANAFGGGAAPFSDGLDGVGGSAEGGTVTISVAGVRSALTLSELTGSAEGTGGIGQNGASGGEGSGGTARYVQASGVATLGDLIISADGSGGETGYGSSDFAGNGGSGTGGTAFVQISSEFHADTVLLGAAGTGQDGGNAFQANAGNGGSGIGGSASIFVVPDVGSSIGSLTVSAAGIGGDGGFVEYFPESGYGGYDFSDLAGSGGSGTGGIALISLRGLAGRASVVNVGSATADAAGSGGTGGGFSNQSSFILPIGPEARAARLLAAGGPGSGGDATGGDATITLSQNVVLGSANALANAVAGNGSAGTVGGSGGAAQGGNATFETINTNGFAIATVNVTALATGGNGASSIGGGAGGDGGSAIGGTALISARSGNSVIGNFSLSTNATGGSGGAGSDGATGFDGGQGGIAMGGTSALVADAGGLLTVDNSGFGGNGQPLTYLITTNATAGSGGAGGDGSDFGDTGGLGGAGGDATGGTARILADGGRLVGPAFELRANAIGGSGGLGGSGASFAGAPGNPEVNPPLPPLPPIAGVTQPRGIAGIGSGGTTEIVASDRFVSGNLSGRIDLGALRLTANGTNGAGPSQVGPLGGFISIRDESLNATGSIFIASLVAQSGPAGGGGFELFSDTGAIRIAGAASIDVGGSVSIAAAGSGGLVVGRALTITSGADVSITHSGQPASGTPFATITASDITSNSQSGFNAAAGSYLVSTDDIDIGTAFGNAFIANAAASDDIRLIIGGDLGIGKLVADGLIRSTSTGATSADDLSADDTISITSGDAGLAIGTLLSGSTTVLSTSGLLTLENGTSGGEFAISGLDVEIGRVATIGTDRRLPGNIVVGATGDASIGTVIARAGFGVQTGGDVSVASATTGTDAVFDFGGNATLGTITAIGGFAAQGGSTLSFGTINAGALVTIATSGNVLGGDATSAADLYIATDGAIAVDSLAAAGLVDLSAVGLASVGNVSAETTVTIGAGSIDIGALSAADATLTSADSSVDEAVLSGALDIRGGRIALGNVTSGGTVFLDAGEQAILFDSITAGGRLDAYAGTLSGGTADISGDAFFTVSGDMSIDRVTTTDEFGYGAITVDAGNLAAGLLNAAGAISVTADSLTGTPAVNGRGEGGSNLVSGESIDLLIGGNALIATADAAQSFNLTAGGNVEFGSILAGVDLTATADGLIEGDSATATGGYLLIRSGTQLVLGSANANFDVDLDGGLGDAQIGTALAGENLLIRSQGRSGVGTGTAGLLLSVTGGNVDVGSVTSSGDRVRLQATSGSVNYGVVAAGTDASITAEFGAVRGGNITTGEDVSVTAGDLVAIGDIRADLGFVTLDAGSDLSFGDVRAIGITARVSGNIDGGSVSTDQGITFDAPGDIVLGNLVSASDSIRLASRTGSVTTGTLTASGAPIAILASDNVSTGAVETNGLFYIGNVSLLETLGSDYDPTVLAGSAPTRVGGNVVISGPVDAGSVAIGAAGSISTSNIKSASDIRLDAGNGFSVGDLLANGLIDLAATDGPVVIGRIATPGQVDIDVGGSIAGTSIVADSGFSIVSDGDVIFDALSATSGYGYIQAGANIDVGEVITGFNFEADAGRDARFGSISTTGEFGYGGQAGPADVLISAGGDGRFGTIDAFGNIDLEIGGGIATYTPIVDTLVPPGLGAGGAVLLSGGNIVVDTGGDALIERAQAGGRIIFDIGGGLRFGSLEAGGRIQSTSGLGTAGNRLAAGTTAVITAGLEGLAIGTLTSGSTTQLTSTGEVVLDDARSGGEFAIRADSVQIGRIATTGADTRVPGSIVITTDGDARITTAIAHSGFGLQTGGDIVVDSITAGANAVLNFAGDATVGTVQAGGGFGAQGSSDSDIGFTSITANSIVTIATGGTVLGGSIASGGNVVIDAGGDVTLQSVIAGLSADITSAGSASIVSGNAQDDFLVDANGSVTLGDIFAGGAEAGYGAGAPDGFSNIIITAGSAISASLLNAQDDIRLTAGAMLDAASLIAGSDIDVAGGSASIDSANAGNDIAIDTTGGLQFGALIAGSDIDIMSGAGLSGISAQAGDDIVVRSGEAGLSITSLTAGRSISLNSLGFITVDLATAGGDLIVDAGGDATLGTIRTTGAEFGYGAGGDISILSDGTIGIASANAFGALSLDAGADIDAGALTSGDGTIIAFGGLAAFDSITAGGDITASGDGAFSATSLTTTGLGDAGDGGADIRITTGGAITIGRVASADDLALTSTAGPATVTTDIVTGGLIDARGTAVTLNAIGLLDVNSATATAGSVSLRGGSIRLRTVSATGDLLAAATGSLQALTNLDIGGRIIFDAGAAITTQDLLGQGTIALTSTAGPITTQDIASIGGVVRISGAGDVNLGDVRAAGSINILGGAAITAGDLTAGTGPLIGGGTGGGGGNGGGIDPATPGIATGFDDFMVVRCDDCATGFITLPFNVNYFGNLYEGTYVSTNGYLTFNNAQGTYTPEGLGTGYAGQPIIAAFFADVDTRNPGSAPVRYGTGTFAGRQAFGATYENVGYFDTEADKLSSFQILLTNRADTGAGNFDIYYNYANVTWETGAASGGVNGFGGVSAAVGYNAGTGNQPGTFFELPGSRVPGSFLNSGPSPLITGTNNGNPGQLLFSVRNGQVMPGGGVGEPAAVHVSNVAAGNTAAITLGNLSGEAVEVHGAGDVSVGDVSVGDRGSGIPAAGLPYATVLDARGALTSGDIMSTGFVALGATQALTTGTIETASSVIVLSDGAIQLGQVTTGRGIGDSLFISSPSILGSDPALAGFSFDTLLTGTAFDPATLATLSAVRGAGTTTIAGPVSTGNLIVATQGGISLSPVDATNRIAIDSGGSVVAASLIAGGDVSVLADQSIDILVGRAGGDFLIDAGTNATLGEILTTGIEVGYGGGPGGDILITTGGLLAASTLAANGAIDIVAGNDVTGGSFTAGSGTTIEGARSVSIASLIAGGDVSVQAGEAIDIDVGQSGGDFLVDAGTDATLGRISATGVEFGYGGGDGGDILITTGGLLSANMLAANGAIDIVAGTDARLAGRIDARDALDVQANSLIAIDGVADGSSVTFASADILIGAAGQVGSAGKTLAVDLTNIGGRTTYIGGSGGNAGYDLSGAELARIFSGDIFIHAPPVQSQTPRSIGSSRAPDVIVGSFTLTSRASSQTGNLGAGGRFAIDTTGKLRVIGDAAFNGFGSGNRVEITANDAIEVDSARGSIILNGTGSLAGTLALTSSDVFVGTMTALADVAAAVDTDAVDERLGRNDGILDDGGAIQAGGIDVAVTGGFFVQNSGVEGTNLDNRRGFTVGEGGLTIRTGGADTRIVINGRQVDPLGGFITGVDFLQAVTITGNDGQAANLFDPRSTINGCLIADTSACNLTAPFFPVQDVIDLILDPTLVTVESIEAPLIELRDFDRFGFAPLIDEPVTGAGNDDLWTDPCTRDPSLPDCPKPDTPAPVAPVVETGAPVK